MNNDFICIHSTSIYDDMDRARKLERLPSEFDLGVVDPNSITVQVQDPDIVCQLRSQMKEIVTVTGGSRLVTTEDSSSINKASIRAPQLLGHDFD